MVVAKRRRRKKQLKFFKDDKLIVGDEWRGMPEYKSQQDPEPKYTMTFKFDSEKDLNEFQQRLLDAEIYRDKKLFNKRFEISAWYPEKKRAPNFIWTTKEPVLPQFPIYIISKGRWDHRYTADLLERVGVPYYIVVEKSEEQKYKERVKGEVLVLPEQYKEKYDMFWNDGGPTGSGPARNFCWDHSVKELGSSHHWLMDDNIQDFLRCNNNLKVVCESGAPLKAMEDFVLRYDNIALAAPHYSFFISERLYYPPFFANTRVMSCILIRNDIPFVWRGRYNEDIDLSLRVLKEGWATVVFNAFLQRKLTTQSVPGGNTEELYGNGTLEKSKMLIEMHPDVTTPLDRFGRDHHYVDYRKFKANPFKKKNSIITRGKNEYGLIMKARKNVG